MVIKKIDYVTVWCSRSLYPHFTSHHLTTESPVAQWLEHLTRSRRVTSSVYLGLEFFLSSHLMMDNVFHVFFRTSVEKKQKKQK